MSKEKAQMKIAELVEDIAVLQKERAAMRKQMARQEEIINKMVSEGADVLKREWARTRCGECGAALPVGKCQKCQK